MGAAVALALALRTAQHDAEAAPTCADFAAPLNETPDAQRSNWQLRWLDARRTVCENGEDSEAIACLRAMGVKQHPFRASGPHVELPDPARCAAGSYPTANLRDGWRLLRAERPDESLRALAGIPESAERELLAAAAFRELAAYDEAESHARTALFLAQGASDRWRIAEAWLALVAVAGGSGEYEDGFKPARRVLESRSVI